MCGIVGAVAERKIIDILLEGLRRQEYRGYDSAGVALVDDNGHMQRDRRVGKVQNLIDAIAENHINGTTGIAHTRWATHGGVTRNNAHPHVSNNNIAIVHNGIIENHQQIKNLVLEYGYQFESETDSEAIAHLIHHELKTAGSLLAAVQKATAQMEGAYGTVVMDSNDKSRIVVARSGSPLVIGLGIGENFVASDILALLPVTNRFIYLEEGDVAEITREKVSIVDITGAPVNREVHESDASHEMDEKGEYRHYMLKEIFEQPVSIRNTLANRLTNDTIADYAFGPNGKATFEKIQHVQIVACGTSFHAGSVAKYWLESYANVSCNIEIASEFRYRKSYTHPNSLLLTISQSGETADTLAALRLSKTQGYLSSLTICNVPGSSLVRESDMSFMTRAGAEIGVASTKAFTTQLVALLMLVLAIGKEKGMSAEQQKDFVVALNSLPIKIEESLNLNDKIKELAPEFADKQHSLFLGRGEQYPIAMEGALKLKEISYIHAEAYAAGELKHGPLALIDADMPIVVVAPGNELIEKLKSNVSEVRARGGILYMFADKDVEFENDESMRVIHVPHVTHILAPIVYTIPLQLLSYHVAIIKGTDVDQPRNLAKSVTVE